MHAVMEIQRTAIPVFALALLLGLPGGKALSAPVEDGAVAQRVTDSANISTLQLRLLYFGAQIAEACSSITW